MTKFGQNGAIVRIRLRNFMTYSDIVMRPGPNLNMILGPNGTGKSAIVCSIIVGLAGEVSLTGRATSPAGLVKKGSDWGSTEIELHNNRGRNFIIERKIIITGRTEGKLEHKSEWKLSKKPALKSEIQSLTKKLNIKVDNLCQFLPQDSVAAFVKMNSSELLLSTLKAAGDNKLVEDHSKLIDLTADISLKSKELEGLQQSCQENEVNARRLESQVEQYRVREKLVEQRKISESKIYHVKYVEAKKEFDNGKKELVRFERELEQVESNSEPFREAVNHNKAQETHYRQAVSRSTGESNAFLDRIQETKASIESRKLDCQREFSKFKSKEEEEKHRDRAIHHKRQELESLECKLNELRDVDHSQEIQRLQAEAQMVRENLFLENSNKSSAEDKLRKIVSDIEYVKRQRDQVLSIKEKKIQIVAGRKPDSHRVIEWLAKNRDKFQKEVFLPMICEINVKDPRYASIIEHAIPENDLFSFFCQTEDDLKTLTRVARQDLRARINVALMPDKSVEMLEREAPAQQYLNVLDVRYFLKDLIDAPEQIMRYLYGNLNFHTVPVLGNCTDSQLSLLLNNCKKFFINNTFYTVSKSRYDNQKMTVTDAVREARFLIYSLDTNKLTELNSTLTRLGTSRNDMEAERRRITDEVDTLKAKWQHLADQLGKLIKLQDQKKTLEASIGICRSAIAKLQDEKIDIEVERRSLQEAIVRVNHRMLTEVAKLGDICENYAKSQHDLSLYLLLHSLANRNYKLAQSKYNNSISDTTRLREEIKIQRLKTTDLEKLAEEARRVAESKIPGFKNKKLDKATVKLFDSVTPDTVETLEQFIAELKARIQGIGRDTNNTIMSEFNRQTEELRAKRQKMMDLEGSIKIMDDERSEIKNEWIHKVQDVIRVINVHYGDFMKSLSYDGLVCLDFEGAHPDNFAAYGIKIMVKYRDSEELISLSGTRQSGGERSVATMIYMLALQTKTTVPFRCVDEINQGMDKENERKVFELLVQTADESSSQYFLVSPKLLSNLPYSEKMRIHVVFNGNKLELDWDEPSSSDEGDDSD